MFAVVKQMPAELAPVELPDPSSDVLASGRAATCCCQGLSRRQFPAPQPWRDSAGGCFLPGQVTAFGIAGQSAVDGVQLPPGCQLTGLPVLFEGVFPSRGAVVKQAKVLQVLQDTVLTQRGQGCGCIARPFDR